MKPPVFDYVRAQSVDHAVSLLAEHGDAARVLAGGQSLVPLLNQRRLCPAVLVDVTRVGGLGGIERRDDALHVGALVTQAGFERAVSPGHIAAQALPFSGHFVTRNRGTVGGSIAHADPRGELALALLTCGGTVTARSARGTRTVAAAELFTGAFTTTLAADELIVETAWPVCGPGDGHAFVEVAQRHGDFTLAAAACALRLRDGRVAAARIGVGAIGDRPALVADAAAPLEGRRPDAALAAEAGAATAAAVDPYGDLHASAAYRRHLAGVLVEQAVRRAAEAAA